MHRLRTLVLGAAATLLLTGCGVDPSSSADRDEGVRTVEVDMLDIAFRPGDLEVQRGETVRFVFTNRGKVTHDAFIGDKAAQDGHEREMRNGEGGGHDAHGDDDDAITVHSGDRGELTYTFDDPGTVEIGCHQPGHYSAGMKVLIGVA